MKKTISIESIYETIKNKNFDYLEEFLYGYVLYNFNKEEQIDIQELIDLIEEKREFTYEYADSNTPVYYKDLADWFSYNWDKVDDYAEEFGINEKNFSIMNIISGAYCMQIANDLENELYDFVKELKELMEEEA